MNGAPWTMTVAGQEITDEDLNVAEVAVTAAMLGNGSWDSLNPWVSPINATNVAAAVIASRTITDDDNPVEFLDQVIALLKKRPISEFIPRKREVTPFTLPPEPEVNGAPKATKPAGKAAPRAKK